MEKKGTEIPGVSRQQLKKIKSLTMPEFRDWLINYSTEMYNLGISDCRDALHEEYGFGKVRLKRMTDNITAKMAAYEKGGGQSEGHGNGKG